MHDFPESTFWGIMFFICEMEGLMIGKSAMQDGKRPEYIPPNIWPPCTIRLRTFQGESALSITHVSAIGSIGSASRCHSYRKKACSDHSLPW